MSHEDRLEICKKNINKMIENSKTKIIFPIITFGILKEFTSFKKTIFTDSEIKKLYIEAVKYFKNLLNHSLHIGGKYYDAYPVRNLPKYNVLKILGKGKFELLDDYKNYAKQLEQWIPSQIEAHINKKLGMIPKLHNYNFKIYIAEDKNMFLKIISENIDRNASNFEIFSFAILKVHLEKFACKIYRETRTSAHDHGVDLSTNFGVVYQIKKLKLLTKKKAEEIYSELKLNFDKERIEDGKIIIIIDDISKDIRKYLIDMKVQSISKSEVLNLANQIDDVEDRLKTLRIIYDEFRREYESDI